MSPTGSAPRSSHLLSYGPAVVALILTVTVFSFAGAWAFDGLPDSETGVFWMAGAVAGIHRSGIVVVSRGWLLVARIAGCETGFAGTGVDLAWYTTRERDYAEVLPWDHLDSGLDRDWLWEDWQDALDETEVDDCRWTPCFDCGVCPEMGTDIQVGPTGRQLLPLSVV